MKVPPYSLLDWQKAGDFSLSLNGFKGYLSKRNACFDLHKRIISFFQLPFFKPAVCRKIHSSMLHLKLLINGDLVTVMWLACLSWPQKLLYSLYLSHWSFWYNYRVPKHYITFQNHQMNHIFGKITNVSKLQYKRI